MVNNHAAQAVFLGVVHYRVTCCLATGDWRLAGLLLDLVLLVVIVVALILR